MTTPPCAANRLPRKHSTRAEAILRPHAVLLLALLLALLLVTGCSEELADWSAIDTGIRHRYPEVPSLTTAQLATWLARADTVQPLLLDVRRPDEVAISHLAGALGVRTVAIFGPTCAGQWRPLGPNVSICRTKCHTALPWPTVEQVMAALGTLP